MYNKFYEQGYEIFEDILEESLCNDLKQELTHIYEIQKRDFTKKQLETIGESNTVRSPLIYSSTFMDLLELDFFKSTVKSILGKHAILSLQNAILVNSKQKHHQNKYHRDIIHQDFTSSKPISINLYFCLDDYCEDNGATIFIPGSHEMEKFPTVYEEVTANAQKGSVILFNSMSYHKAGINTDGSSRFGINHMVSLPFIKQQIDYARILPKSSNDELNQMLGFNSKEFKDVKEFRQYRLNRIV